MKKREFIDHPSHIDTREGMYEAERVVLARHIYLGGTPTRALVSVVSAIGHRFEVESPLGFVGSAKQAWKETGDTGLQLIAVGKIEVAENSFSEVMLTSERLDPEAASRGERGVIAKSIEDIAKLYEEVPPLELDTRLPLGSFPSICDWDTDIVEVYPYFAFDLDLLLDQ